MQIRSITAEELDEAARFCWGLATSPETSSYQRFFSLPELAERIALRYSQPESIVLGAWRGDTLCGVVFGYYEEIPYFQLDGFYVNSGDQETASAFLSIAEELHPSVWTAVGIPAENRAVSAALKEHGFTLMEQSVDLRMTASEFCGALPAEEVPQIRRVTPELAPAYLKFHRAAYGDGLYWNAERLGEDLASPDGVCWVWEVLEGDTPVGSCWGHFYRGERINVYGIEARQTDWLPLLRRAISGALEAQPSTKAITFFIDSTPECHVAEATGIGFRILSHYNGYEKNTPQFA